MFVRKYKLVKQLTEKVLRYQLRVTAPPSKEDGAFFSNHRSYLNKLKTY